ncbi:MAG: ornithine cyclodeaminase family protein [Hyphomicrobiales bacterium]|nr:ornithine cyclodeaminase family protein [Hyphomicrobiales bacterium]
MTANATIPHLTYSELSRLGISTSDVVDVIEKFIAGSANGSVWSAPKAVILPGDGRYMLATLAAADDPALLAVKTVVLNPRNPDRGLPQINGLVTILDSETGLPVAIVDGNWVTAVRTAGLSAVAAKYMAKPESSVVGFVGCGVQARSHLHAFSDLFTLRAIRVFGRGQKNIDALCLMAEEIGLTSTVCSSGDEAIENADLVVSSVTATGGFEPFLNADRLAKGCFAAITDLGVPWRNDKLAVFDRIVIDDLAQEAALPNKLADPQLVTGDLSQLVLGKISGREAAGDRTAFLFRGHAIGDLALASLAYQKFKNG